MRGPMTSPSFTARVLAHAALLASFHAASCSPSDTAATAGTTGTPSKSGGAGPAAPVEPTRDVRTFVVAQRPWEQTLRVTGELAAHDEATISTEVAGRLEVLSVDVGSRVKAGETMAVVEVRDFELERDRISAELHAARARLGLPPDGDDDTVVPENTPLVAQARIALEDAIRRRDRLVEAAKSGAATQSDTDTAVAAVETAEAHRRDALEEIASRRALLAQRRAELAIALKEIEDTRIAAPFDGIVLERRVSRGDFLTVGQVVAKLVRVDPVRLRLQIPELEATRVTTGQRVTFTPAGDTTPWTATIARSSPSIDVRNRTLTVEADVPNAECRLRPGAFVQASILIDANTRATAVPLSSITSFAGVDKVIAVVDGKAAERRVRIGRKDANDAEILSGLVPGDVVVLEPGNLQTGTPVRAVAGK